MAEMRDGLREPVTSFPDLDLDSRTGELQSVQIAEERHRDRIAGEDLIR
jgi:hypothetical protein